MNEVLTKVKGEKQSQNGQISMTVQFLIIDFLYLILVQKVSETVLKIWDITINSGLYGTLL